MAAYKHFTDVLIADGKKEPTGKPSRELLELTTGYETNFVRNDAAYNLKHRSRIVQGNVAVGPVSVSDRARKALFEVCLDYRKIKTENNGKPIKTVSWLRNRVHMQRSGNRWLVSDEDGWKGKIKDSCPRGIRAGHSR